MPTPKNTFTSSETPDMHKLQIIRDNWEAIPLPNMLREEWTINEKVYNPLVLISKYLNKNKNGAVHVAYRNSTKAQTHGRQYAVDALSMQGFSRQIRHTVCAESMFDIDIVNCHPTIFVQFCNKKNYVCDHVQYYADNRNECLDELITENDVTKDEAKTVVLALMNGGKEDYEKLTFKPVWLERFASQIAGIHTQIYNNPDYKALIAQVKRNKKKNIEGSVANHVLCDIENSILLACMDFLRSRNISVNNVILMFDGFMIPKSLTSMSQAFFDELSNFVFDKTGYKMKYVEKAMDEIIDLSGFAIKPNDKSYDAIKNTFEETHFKLMSPYMFGEISKCGLKYELYDETALRGKYRNVCFVNDGTTSDKPFIDAWLKDTDINTFYKLESYPPGCNKAVDAENYNTWLKFKWQLNSPVEVGDTALINQHLLLVSGNDIPTYEYVKKWIASIIQKPGQKTGIVLCIVGAEGIGKTLLMEALKLLVGAEKFMSSNDPTRDLFSRFSAEWASKLIIVLNDYNTGDTRNNDKEKLKSKVTDTDTELEIKGGKQYNIDNYANFITTTNNYNPVHLNSESRRYCLFEASSDKKGDTAYFKTVVDWFSNEANISAWFTELMQVNLDEFDIRKFPTSALTDIIKNENCNNTELFLSHDIDNIAASIVYKKYNAAQQFVLCKKKDDGAIPCFMQTILAELYMTWALNNLDQKTNSKKIQSDMFKLREALKLEWKPNTNNSKYSCWIIKDITKFLPLEFIEDV